MGISHYTVYTFLCVKDIYFGLYNNSGAEQTSRNVHSQRLRSSSRPNERELRDPATAQNTDYTPPSSRLKSGFPKK